MNFEQAVAIRQRQLKGEAVDKTELHEAVEFIKSHKFTPLTKNAGPKGKRKATSNPWELSPQEVRVMDYLVQGHRSSDIGRKMGVKRATVGSYVFRVCDHMKVDNSVQAVILWNEFRSKKANASMDDGDYHLQVRDEATQIPVSQEESDKIDDALGLEVVRIRVTKEQGQMIREKAKGLGLNWMSMCRAILKAGVINFVYDTDGQDKVDGN